MGMNLLRRIKAIYRKHKADQFLKKHRCRTWEQYNYRYDKLIDLRATYIGQYYHGYPYVIEILDYSHPIYDYTDHGLFSESTGALKVLDWCRKNCKGKARVDELTVITNGGNIREWVMHPLGNYVYCIAFETQIDCNWFVLRWL